MTHHEELARAMLTQNIGSSTEIGNGHGPARATGQYLPSAAVGGFFSLEGAQLFVFGSVS